MNRLISKILTWIFIKTGSKLFRLIAIWSPVPNSGTIHVITFAKSERDLNTSTREFVEALDASYESTHEEKK